jgi:hypothetical protein
MSEQSEYDQDRPANTDWSMPLVPLHGPIPKSVNTFDIFEFFHDDGRPYNVKLYRRKGETSPRNMWVTNIDHWA